MNYADEKYDVRFRHIRKSKKNGKKIGMICSVKDKESNEIGIGWSLCCKKDRYNVQVGADIAYGRAMEVLEGKIYGNVPDVVEKFIREKHRRLSNNIVPITFLKLKIQDGTIDIRNLAFHHSSKPRKYYSKSKLNSLVNFLNVPRPEIHMEVNSKNQEEIKSEKI